MELINHIVKHIDHNNVDKNQHYYLYFTSCKVSKTSISPKINSIKHLIYENNFIKDEERNRLIGIFNKAQKIYWGFTKLAIIFKYKKLRIFDNHISLYGLDFESCNKSQRIILVENNTKYEFRINELIKLLKISLENSNGLVPNPRIPRNPYTSLPFSIANLYNIYFFAKFNTCINIPSICCLFFSLSFDIEKFREFFYPQLKEKSIKNYMIETDDQILFYDCLNMIRAHGKLFNNANLNEHMELKYKKELVQLFKPKLNNYLFSVLSHNPYTKKKNGKLFNSGVKQFMRDNPTFGRRIFYRQNSGITTRFNIFAPPVIDLSVSDEDMVLSDNDDSTDTDETSDEDI